MKTGFAFALITAAHFSSTVAANGGTAQYTDNYWMM